MTFKVLSLFSGCGGMDLGMEGGFTFLRKRYRKTPFQISQAIDFDQRAVDIYNANFKVKCEARDILTTPTDFFEQHDVLIGGFPCQSFSIVAQNPKRLGYKDKKGKLFFEICRICRAWKPRALIAENVKGLLNANKGEAFRLVLQELEESGYHVTHKLIDSSDFGVPQKRERVFIVGFKFKKDLKRFSFPKSTHASPEVKIPLADVLEDNRSVHESFYFSDRALAGLHRTKHLVYMNKGRVQDPSQPCNTVGAHLAKVSLNSTDPVLMVRNRLRMFTPREVARIQSFPERFKLAEAKTVNYRALGNAVPPVVMWHIARSLQKALD